MEYGLWAMVQTIAHTLWYGIYHRLCQANPANHGGLSHLNPRLQQANLAKHSGLLGLDHRLWLANIAQHVALCFQWSVECKVS